MPAPLLGMMLTAVSVIVTGCVAGPSGPLIGPDALDVMIARLNGHGQCNHCRSEYVAGCQSCDTSARHGNGCTDCNDDTKILKDDVDFITPAYDEFIDSSYDSACDDGQCPPAVDKRPGWFSLRRYYEPEAGIFNFFVPPASIGAPAPPPPGRFHPVPTRHVFSPQPSPFFGLPPGA